MAKKILYIKAQWLWDMIGGIPFLATMKQQWYEVYQTFYDMRHINKWVEKLTREQKEKYKKWPMYGWRLSILEHFKKQNLIKDIVFIPYWYWNLLKFFIKNFRKFDEVVVPIKTRPALFLSYILWKTHRIIFQWTNDISKYTLLADGEVCGTALPLFAYRDEVNREMKQCSLPSSSYITIFPSIYERSLESIVWKEVILYCRKKWLDVVVIWWDREKWFLDYLWHDFVASEVINLIGKNLPESAYIMSKAKWTISWNGWPMRIANLVHKNCLNIHTVSAYLMQPPVDKISSFNIRPYQYNKCTPCEAANSTIWETWMKPCVFYGTDDEWACRKAITYIEIKRYIDLILR